MSNCCSYKTLPHLNPQSSLLSSCYYHQDLHKQGHSTQACAASFITSPHALLLMTAASVQCWLDVSHPLERHPFSGPVHSAGELLHTPQRISTSMTTVLLFKWTNTFYGIWWASSAALYPSVRLIPHRQFCLPKMAHIEFVFIPQVHIRNQWILPI